MKRNIPNFILIPGILSLINIVITFFSSILNIISGGPSADKMRKTQIEFAVQLNELKKEGASQELLDYFNDFIQLIVIMNENMVLYSCINVLITLLGIISLFLLFKQKLLGFHLYIIYCFTSSISLYSIASPVQVPSILIILNLLVSGFFIFLFSRSLSWIKGEIN